MIPIFVINRKSDKDRRTFLELQLQCLPADFKWTFIEAVEITKLSSAEIADLYDKNKAIAQIGRELGAGEIGCALSHCSVYKRMISENIPYALILEDDAMLNWDVIEICRSLAQFFDHDAEKVAILNGGRGINRGWPDLKFNRRGLYPAKEEMMAGAYFISLRAAKQMLKYQTPVCDVADCWSRVRRTGLKIYSVLPPCVDAESLLGMKSVINQKTCKENEKIKIIQRIIFHAKKIKRMWYVITGL